MLKLIAVKGRSLEETQEPVFVMRDGKLFRTIYHPEGWSDHPDYELKDDGRIYRTPHHELGRGHQPDYEIRPDRKIYRTTDHPKGPTERPEFQLMD